MRAMRLSLILLLAGLAFTAAPPRHTVKLADGRSLDGHLVRVTPALYLLQSEREMLELSEDEIAAVDGKAMKAGSATRLENLRVWRKYEEVQADGRVLAWDSFEIQNDGTTAITEVSFGLGPHELAGALSVDYLDALGNKLKTRMEPSLAQEPKAQRRMLVIALALPVAPGESATLSSKRVQTEAIRSSSEGLSLTFNGDFPDDRLLWRKVRLPQGARVLKTTPEPTARFEHEGCTYLMWRRFFWAGEQAPTTVLYKLR